MGEEEDKALQSTSPAVTTTTVPHKKPVRHHVKRRSSGRVHVAKLAPLARANSNTHIDSEVLDDNESKPVMKRSQSNRSLHKMSDRKGLMPMTPRRKSTASSEKLTAFQVVSSLPTPSTSNNKEEKQPEPPTDNTSTNNPVSLSSTVVAAPVEQTFNAVANNLVVPKTADYTKIVTPPKSDASNKKQLLRSQFLTSEESLTTKKPASDTAFTTKSNSNHSISRTQQKLMLQKQQAQSEDENNVSHPRNMSKLNKEFDMVGREYRCIKRYQDPMLVSLVRCVEKLDIKLSNPHIASRLQLGANQHSVSSSVVPSLNTFSSQIPHLEQRQIAHRHHHLKTVALSRATKQHSQPNMSKQDNNNNNNGVFAAFPWNATTLIDKLFSSNSTEN